MTKEELPTTLREMVYMLDIADNNKNPVLKRILRKMREAADEIESLQSQLSQVMAERDAAVVHGQWESYITIPGVKGKYFPAVSCSECGISFCDLINNHKNMYHYCPHCGAKMDKEN